MFYVVTGQIRFQVPLSAGQGIAILGNRLGFRKEFGTVVALLLTVKTL